MHGAHGEHARESRSVAREGKRPLQCTARGGARVGDAADLIETEGLGWTANPEAEHLGTVILEALASGDEMNRGRTARKLAETRLPWTEMARGLEKFYDKVLHGQRSIG